MRIAVFVKQVPANLRVPMGADGSLDRSGIETITNPADQTALLIGARLKKQTGGKMACFTMGPEPAAACLREGALAGADELYHLCDKDLAGADTLITAKALSAALRKTGEAQLLLVGRHSVDGSTGQVGPEMAAMLDMPCLTGVIEAESMGEKVLKCTCMTDMGAEVYRVELPALFCVSESKLPASLPSLMDMRRAASRQITLLTLKDIGLEGLRGREHSPTKVAGVTPKGPSVRRVRFLDGQAMDQAMEVLEPLICRAMGGEGP